MGICDSRENSGQDGVKGSTSVRFPATAWCPTPGIKPSPPLPFPEFKDDDTKGSFEAVGDVLIAEATAHLNTYYELPEKEVSWLQAMLEYNVKGGKMTRGLMVLESAVEIWKHQKKPMDSDTKNKMCVLGWCVEWLQAWLLVADDFMDSSQTRRGQPCWYLQPHVKQVALNDAFTIEMMVFKLIKRFFGDEPYYLQLIDLFQETTFQTELGQLCDTLCMNMDINEFTVDLWTLIVKYKTSFYSFYLPVALGMICGGINHVEAYQSARDILIRMGIYFQAQDDFLDAFADPETLGKIGTDIQDKKCGWLFVHVYNSLASAEQKKVLDATYGKCKVGSPEEAAIKAMYAELGMESFYEKYEQAEKEQCELMMQSIDPALPKAIFEKFLAKVFKRRK